MADRLRRLSLMSATVAALMLALTAGAGGADPSPFPDDSPVILEPAVVITGATLAEAVDAVNAEVVARGYPLEPLQLTDFITWLDEAKDLDLIQAQRDAVWPAIQAGLMPEGWGFELRDLVGPEVLVHPFYLPIVDAHGFAPYVDYYRDLLAPDLDLATEPWVGPPPSLTDAPLLPSSIGVRVTPIEVAGEALAPPGERDALQVEIRLSPDALDAAADYFGQGSGPDVMRQRLGDLLGDASERWIDLKAILPNWVGERANTFPAGEDTEVCYGAAREFFYPQQDARHNRSTEASNLLLHDYYCLLPDEAAPTFGDYLNVPNVHAGRYILKDPASGRDIAFSVQSGGNAPYRFYWVDEDFSVQPFGHSPDPDVFRTRIDAWRRCSA